MAMRLRRTPDETDQRFQSAIRRENFELAHPHTGKNLPGVVRVYSHAVLMQGVAVAESPPSLMAGAGPISVNLRKRSFRVARRLPRSTN